jgi:hypothetical protein
LYIICTCRSKTQGKCVDFSQKHSFDTSKKCFGGLSSEASAMEKCAVNAPKDTTIIHAQTLGGSPSRNKWKDAAKD